MDHASVRDLAAAASIRAINARRLAPLSEMYSVFSLGERASPLGLNAVVKPEWRRPHCRSGRGLEIEITRLGADVARVGDKDMSIAIDGYIIGAVELLVVVVVGERANRTVAGGDRNAAAAAVVGALGDDQPAELIPNQPVGPAARLAEYRSPAAPRVKTEDPVADVGKKDRAVLVEHLQPLRW